MRPRCISIIEGPDNRRIIYLRYAGEFVVLITGIKKDAEQMKNSLAEFLRSNCGLELNKDKTSISIVNTREGFIFLGAECKRRDTDSVYNSRKGQKITRRSAPRLAVDAPIKRIMGMFIKFGYARRNHKNKIIARGITNIIHLDHGMIISSFNRKIIGILNAYSFAGNFSLMAKLV